MSRNKGSAQTRSSAPRTSSSRSPRSSPSAPRSPSTSSSAAAAAQRRSPPASSSLPSQRRASQPAQLPITTASPPVSPHPQSSATSSTTPSRRWAEGRAAATADIEKSAAAASSYFSPSSLGVMSPLARALQAQWRQLQQDLLSPSALHIDRSHHTTAEDDVLRVLRSIGKFAEEAVEDAAHTVPYLLAFAVTPLPTVATQVVALAALRGVLSSLPSVYGAAEARAFVEDVCLGEHQALQALSLCALVALEKTEEETSGPSSAAGATAARRSPSSFSAGKPRGGHRSLLSRNGDTRSSEDPLHALLQGPTRRAAGDGNGSSGGGGKPHSTSFTAGASPQQDVMELQSRVAHLSLRLLGDVATLCPAVADALLSSDALLKRALRALTSCAHVTASDKAVWRVAGRRTTEDVLRVLLTLLKSEAAQHNEAALVLCSYDAPRAVAALTQTLAYRSYNACGAVRDVTAAEEAVPHASAEQLLWSALKVLGWLTRGCPAGLRSYLSEVTTTPSLLAQVLTVPVAEIREAAALWLAALLETQPAASLQLVQDLFSLTPPSAEPAASPMGALVEMLRWRGAQMHVYGVSAMVCWRWMLLSHPTRVAALLPQDAGLLATLMELVFRVAPSLQLAAERAGEDEKTSSLEKTMASLPLRLIALEAAHVLTLSFALGSLETRTRLVTHFMSGSLSPLTLQKLRDTASLLVSKTHPGYYDDFPAMEVKLAEPELSEAMQRAGATVSSTAPPAADASAAASALVPQRTQTSVVVRLSSGAQWRQLILENLAELTAGAEQPPSSLPTALVPRRDTPAASSIVSSSSKVKPGDESSRSRNRSRQAGAKVLVMPRDGVLRASAQSAAGAVAPIRVLGVTAPQQQSSAALHSCMNDDAVVSDEEEEHRVDIGAIISTSLAEGQGHAFSSPFLEGSASREAAVPRVPRTVREATLLPTSLSTTALRYAVVQQAEGLGGLFVQDSMRTVLQLAQHYTSSHATAAAVGTSGVSAKLVQAVTADRRASRVRGSAKVSHIDASVLEAPAGQRARSPSAVFGSAPRFDPAPRKERNPFAPAAKAASAQRAWTVQELQREDVLLFLVRYTRLMTELPEAVAAVEDHLYFLRRQLQLCPTRDVRRRCVLNDLYMNVYPTMHLFLRFVDQQARRSRGVLQMLSSLNGGTLHSGNVLEAYDAVGQCTGLTVEL